MSEPLTYKSSGVDLDLYQEAMGRLPSLAQRTFTPRVQQLTGGFAGLFRLFGDGKKYTDPVLVSGTDGVGTKLKLAHMSKKYNTIGIDLVAMCVNDCLCLGAEPLFFLDYLALGKDNPDLIASLVSGISDGCVEAGAALIGGETAIMPDVYPNGEFDLAGFCVGVVERDKMITGSRIQPGDVVIGLPSSGVHSNGYSLVRNIVFKHAKLTVNDYVENLNATVEDVLLEPTKIYARPLSELLSEDERRWSVTGIAHITGGGLIENPPRILPEGCRMEISKKAWQVPDLFGWLQALGNVPEDEMWRVFNMGIGLVLTVKESSADTVIENLKNSGESPMVLGRVVSGEKGIDLLSTSIR
ncbi:phosphoribosylformylglycinamidine cyclo-ligase [Lacunimicrobium album]